MNQQKNHGTFSRISFVDGCIAAFMFGAPATSFAGPAILECPVSIPEKSVQLVGTPAGWKSFVASPLYLHAAAPMSTPPEMLGELIEDAEHHDKKGTTYTYKIDGKFPDGKWLACKYGESDQVTLARQLPDDTNVCRITYRKGVHVGQNDIKIDCK